MPLVRLSAEDPPEPSLAPMIDVVLVLTIFFMCATRFSEQERSFDVDLPRAASADSGSAGRPCVVDVGADGTVHLRGDAVSIDELPDVMRRLVAEGSDQTVLVRGDRSASHGRMAEVYEACRSAGVRHVGIAVQVSSAMAAGSDRRR